MVWMRGGVGGILVNIFCLVGLALEKETDRKSVV